MKTVAVMKNGKCFDRFISGKMKDEQQVFTIADEIKELEGTDLVGVTPTEDTEIHWTDGMNETHITRLYAGRSIAVLPEFIKETDIVKEMSVMKNGKCFDRYIRGTVANPEQKVIVAIKGKVENTDLLSVIPAEDTDIHWTDEHGETHISHLYRNVAFAVLPEFLEEVPDFAPLKKA